MRKLMSFRKDELILPEESEDEEEEEQPSNGPVKQKNISGIEDAYELVDTIEQQMSNISNVIKGMDKRMSYNLRLIGSVVIQNELKGETDKEKLEIINLVKKKSMIEKKQKVIPKIKKMSDFTMTKLDMNNAVD